ncbi:carboxymuconolactone decarboxylase family protein [Pendulispora albinea]|uniref:Carboxymuconolactone decarboxylase family protein n=1 Tax=Pendulispora albinea TaxID=2741071 RepID=A0ABZ2M126_9BACT
MAPRIVPLGPPYSAEVQASLAKWMPPGSGVQPLKIFRTIARHEHLSARMRGLGGALLGRGTLPLRVRELLILRTCARCGAEYEWGVHVSAFAAAAGLSDEIVAGTAQRSPADLAETESADDLVQRFADELHDTHTVSERTWSSLAAHFDANALLEMLAVVGFYHTISFIVNAARIEHEPWAATFPAPSSTA